jgi:hypothetical protein
MLRHDTPQPLAHQIGIFLDRLGDRAEDHAGGFQFLAERGRHGHAVEHRIHCDAALGAAIRLGLDNAGEHLLLGNRNTELLVDAQDLGIDLVERTELRLHFGFRVIIGVLVIDRIDLQLRPVRSLQRQPEAIRLQPPVEHPLRLALLGRDESHGIFGKTLWREFLLDVRMETPLVRLVRGLIGFGVLGGHFSSRPQCPGGGRGPVERVHVAKRRLPLSRVPRRSPGLRRGTRQDWPATRLPAHRAPRH